MSSVVIAGDTSGTVTLAAPAVAGTTTLTLPSTSGNVVTDSATQTLTNKTLTSPTITGANITVASTAAPTFRATRSGSTQSLTNGVWNKVQFDTETWDTNSNYDNSTNYRFTPTVAGYYYVDVSIELNNLTGSYVSAVYKNGTEFIKYPVYVGSTTQGSITNVHGLVYLNGSTDYIEAYVYSYTNSQAVYGTNASYFSAFLARSA